MTTFDNIYPFRIKIIQVAAGFRSSFFMTENRLILYAGIIGGGSASKLPNKFVTKIMVC